MSPVILQQLAKGGPAVLLAVLVWYEVHQMREDVGQLAQGIAVLVDRCQAEAPAAR